MSRMCRRPICIFLLQRAYQQDILTSVLISFVDTLLQHDSASRVAAEVFLSGNHIIIGGEVKTTAPTDETFYHKIATDALHKIGYPERLGLSTMRYFIPMKQSIISMYPDSRPILRWVLKKRIRKSAQATKGSCSAMRLQSVTIACLQPLHIPGRYEIYSTPTHSSIQRRSVSISKHRSR